MSTDPTPSSLAGSAGGIAFEVLLFECAGGRYLARLDAVAEVLMPALLRSIPGSPPALLGVLNLRGDMLPVVDLGEQLSAGQGVGSHRTGSAGAWHRRDRILRIETDGQALGIAVDAVHGIRTLGPEQRRQRILNDDASAGLLGDLWQIGGETLQEIHLNALLNRETLAKLTPQLHGMLS
ncbi:MAG: chemotaxis protein CheW [Thiohalocapsa sp.]